MPEPLDPDRLVSITQACALVAVSRRTIYNWIAQDKIAFTRTASGRVRIVAASLMNMTTLTKAQHKQVWDLANRTREVLAQKDRLISTDLIMLLGEILTLLESLTK